MQARHALHASAWMTGKGFPSNLSDGAGRGDRARGTEPTASTPTIRIAPKGHVLSHRPQRVQVEPLTVAYKRPPRRIAIQTALVLPAVFLAGEFAGARRARWVMTGLPPMRLPPPFPGPFFEVDLSAEQDRAGREVLERHRPEIETILRETFPKVREVNERIEKELREVLTAEQQKRFDDLKRERPRRPT